MPHLIPTGASQYSSNIMLSQLIYAHHYDHLKPYRFSWSTIKLNSCKETLDNIQWFFDFIYRRHLYWKCTPHILSLHTGWVTASNQCHIKKFMAFRFLTSYHQYSVSLSFDKIHSLVSKWGRSIRAISRDKKPSPQDFTRCVFLCAKGVSYLVSWYYRLRSVRCWGLHE